ncbi:hypothetical protein GS397_26355 (plasmid) [Sphingobium yanoikuyae]|uniref:Uncharacterized protein n=1 Tax=Sphingobium yanoikuyae TaxID=13690 RepID=A0A6P1GQY6_SPHYA|nr:hypothetical protein [Sphingobium yanoikuyae]QHD70634.1 hypothetical protein GS397_26355 [Sphingobium yanoikuyae]
MESRPPSFQICTLSERLEVADGPDPTIDEEIARVFQTEPADFLSSAVAARKLVGDVWPEARLNVGYDVSGVFPTATVTCGKKRGSSVAPTVSLAILRALMGALK